MTRNTVHWRKILLATALATRIVVPAHAQNSTDAAPPAANTADSGAGDIVVTANRRQERAQNVGISLTAVTSGSLEANNIRSAEDLAKLVPGLNSTNSSGSAVSTIIIRGVGQSDFDDHQEQPNATYVDGVYIPFSTAVGIPIFDIQRAEVLRGPQGTLFGRNSTGGLVQYISNQPSEGLNGSAEGAVGGRNLRRAQGAINDGNDKIAGRLAFFYQDQDGIIKNVSGPNRGNKQVFALRGQIELKPDDKTQIKLRVEGYNQNGTAPGYIAMPAYYNGLYGAYLPANVNAYGTGPGLDLYGYRNPYYPDLKVNLDNPGKLKKRSRLYSMTIERKVGSATLTSITAYGSIHNEYVEDTDSGPINEFNAGNTTNAHDFQQDLRISGSSGKFRYTLGGFYIDISGQYGLYNYFDAYLSNAVGVNLGATPLSDHVIVQNSYGVKNNSKAIYGQAEYDLVPKLTLIVGGRYNRDDVQLVNASVSCLQTIANGCNVLAATTVTSLNQMTTALGPLAITNKYGNWSGRVQLNYKPVEHVLLYASVNRGTKSAGFTAPLTGSFPLNQISYKPETLYAFEVGEKAQFLDRRVTLNSDFYYYDYRNFQTFLFQGVATEVLNRNAYAYGSEVELSARMPGDFNANFGAAFNHFEVHGISTPSAPLGENQQPNDAPRLQLIWGLNKSQSLGNFKLSLNYSGRYVGSAYYNIVNVPIVKTPGYVVQDISARLESDKGYWVGAFLDNMFDKRYQVGAFDVTFFTWSLRQFGEPRTFSIAAGVKF